MNRNHAFQVGFFSLYSLSRNVVESSNQLRKRTYNFKRTQVYTMPH